VEVRVEVEEVLEVKLKVLVNEWTDASVNNKVAQRTPHTTMTSLRYPNVLMV
jgi:hypothetical protein